MESVRRYFRRDSKHSGDLESANADQEAIMYRSGGWKPSEGPEAMTLDERPIYYHADPDTGFLNHLKATLHHRRTIGVPPQSPFKYEADWQRPHIKTPSHPKIAQPKVVVDDFERQASQVSINEKSSRDLAERVVRCLDPPSFKPDQHLSGFSAVRQNPRSSHDVYRGMRDSRHDIVWIGVHDEPMAKTDSRLVSGPIIQTPTRVDVEHPRPALMETANYFKWRLHNYDPEAIKLLPETITPKYFHDFGLWLYSGKIIAYSHNGAKYAVEDCAIRLVKAVELSKILDSQPYMDAALHELYELGRHSEEPKHQLVTILGKTIGLLAFYDYTRWLHAGMIIPLDQTDPVTTTRRLIEAMHLAVILDVRRYMEYAMRGFYEIGHYLEMPEVHIDGIFDVTGRTAEPDRLRWLIVSVVASKVEADAIGRRKLNVDLIQVHFKEFNRMFGKWYAKMGGRMGYGCQYPRTYEEATGHSV